MAREKVDRGGLPFEKIERWSYHCGRPHLPFLPSPSYFSASSRSFLSFY